jgi:hypothetical protein
VRGELDASTQMLHIGLADHRSLVRVAGVVRSRSVVPTRRRPPAGSDALVESVSIGDMGRGGTSRDVSGPA